MQTKILMVCLGNICRSPLAEGILRSKVDPSKVMVDSAGTLDLHVGHPPDPRSISVGKKYAINITQLCGRQIKKKDFETYDIIYVMDVSNKENVLKLAQNESQRKKVKLILDEIFPGENVEVPDPYFGGPQGFEDVYKLLNEACEAIAKRF